MSQTGSDSAAPVSSPDGRAVAVVKVKRVYEQVADQLRDLVLKGELPVGRQLPSEQSLARDFGVSRATIREALRTLIAENLLGTTRGATGGSFVLRPDADKAAEALEAALSMLSLAGDLTLEEFFEARAQLEVPAAGLAAVRRTDVQLAELEAAIAVDPSALDADDQFTQHRLFHTMVAALSGNTLICIETAPIVAVLQRNLKRSKPPAKLHERIHDDHRRIADAIGRGDQRGAEEAMRDHLEHLRSQYDQIWRLARRPLA